MARGERGTLLSLLRWRIASSVYLCRLSEEALSGGREANRPSEGQPKQGALANDYGGFKTKEMKATNS